MILLSFIGVGCGFSADESREETSGKREGKGFDKGIYELYKDVPANVFLHFRTFDIL